jgi:hypothetical protein
VSEKLPQEKRSAEIKRKTFRSDDYSRVNYIPPVGDSTAGNVRIFILWEVSLQNVRV